jgi:acyl dehydratase
MTAITTDDVRSRWEKLIDQPHTGDWFSVHAERVAAFEFASYFDETDEDDEYPEGLVEGFHLLALLDKFGRVLDVDAPGHLSWNYGLNRVRFITPVRVGDRLRLTATVTGVSPKGEDAFLTTVAYVAELEGAPRPAFAAEMVAYHERLDESPNASTA